MCAATPIRSGPAGGLGELGGRYAQQIAAVRRTEGIRTAHASGSYERAQLGQAMRAFISALVMARSLLPSDGSRSRALG